MSDFEIYGDQQRGEKFVKSIEKKKFLFSLAISYTETCEVPGITVAGADIDSLKFTPPADAEFLHYGYCKCIDTIPITPDGKPTPAVLTKVALEAASIPHVVINGGSKVLPQVPYYETGLEYGKNIEKEPALDRFFVLRAVDYGRIIGRALASVTDCLVIGESIPGGTTTALAVLKGFDVDAKVSSSSLENPTELKNKVVSKALERSKHKDSYDLIANLGDPMIPLVTGMVSSASQITNVLLAGGTQMPAILAFGDSVGLDKRKIAIATTSYIVNDETANFLDVVEELGNVPVLAVDPKLDESKIEGLQAYSNGFVKEGVGAGGSIIAGMLKSGITTDSLLPLFEKEYDRLTTLQSQTLQDS